MEKKQCGKLDLNVFKMMLGSGGNDELLLKQGINYHTVLTLCMLGNFSFFCCRLLFSILFLFKNFFQEHYQSVKQFGSRSRPTFRLS